MKKIITLITSLLAVSIFFFSCNDGEVVDYSPYRGGILLYGNAYTMNSVALDPVAVAFRLNVLLSTAKDQGKTPENVTIKITEGEGENAKEVEKNLKTYLFESNAVSSTANGVWTLTFTSATAGKDDIKREGTITVNTLGKLLEELEPDEYWDVAVNNSNYKVHNDGKWIVGDSAAGQSLSLSGFSYAIVATHSPNEWDIVTGEHIIGETGKWEMEYTIRSSVDKQIYDNMSVSRLFLSGEASGKPTSLDHKVEYTVIGELEYNLSCGRNITVMGSEQVDSESLSTAYPEIFPSSTVVVKSKNSSTCKLVQSITYNGYIASDVSGGVLIY